MIKAIIHVPAPRPQVFGALTDYPSYKNWLPGCEESNVTNKAGNTTDTEIVVKSMKTMRMGLRFEASGDQLLNFRMISGKDMKAYEGSYRLMDSSDGGGTVVVAELSIDAGALAPRFMVDRIAKKAVDDTGKALCSYMKTIISHGPAPAQKKKARPGRARRLLQIGRTEKGYRLWLSGRVFDLKGD